MLYVFDQNTGEQTTYEYEQHVVLTGDVCRISLNLDTVVEAVLKKKEKFSFEDAVLTMREIVDTRSSRIVRETALHSFLAKEVPQHITPLVFARSGKFTYIVAGKKLVPVKISVYRPRDTLRADLKLGQKARYAAQRLVANAIDTYFDGEEQENADWAQTRNVIYSNGTCLFHDFDMSV